MRLTQDVLRPLLDHCCEVCLDDILIYSKSLDEHTGHLRAVLNLLQKHRLYAKLSKCVFFKTSVRYLGYIVDSKGISMEQSKISAVQDWPLPENRHQLMQFLGLCNSYSQTSLSGCLVSVDFALSNRLVETSEVYVRIAVSLSDRNTVSERFS